MHLFCSSSHTEERQSLRIIEKLIKRGSNVNAANKYLKRPLELAINHNCFEIAKVLWSKKPDVNAGNKYQESPLIIAAQTKDDGLIHMTSGSRIFIT